MINFKLFDLVVFAIGAFFAINSFAMRGGVSVIRDAQPNIYSEIRTGDIPGSVKYMPNTDNIRVYNRYDSLKSKTLKQLTADDSDVIMDKMKHSSGNLIDGDGSNYPNNKLNSLRLDDKTPPCAACYPSQVITGLGNVITEGTKIGGVKAESYLEGIYNNINSGTRSGSMLTTEETRLLACEHAVESLRGGAGGLGNTIIDYDKLCISENIAQCRAAYSSYVDNCLYQPEGLINDAIIGRVGILFVTDSYGKYTPWCTGTLISKDTIVTSRHCYTVSNEIIEYFKGDGNSFLKFAPNPKILSFQSESGYNLVDIVGEVTNDGLANIELKNKEPSLSDDIIVLKLSKPLSLEEPILHIKWTQLTELKNTVRVALVGYQEMASRREKMQANEFDEIKIPDKASISGYFNYIMADLGPMCIISAQDSGGFNHFCQSLQGTSGAPIFTMDLMGLTGSTINLIGVQSRGVPYSMPGKELMSGAPNSAANESDILIKVLNESN